MTRGEVITSIYALFNAPHNADINIVGLNKVLDDLVSAEREACSSIASDYAQRLNSMTAVNIADAIRARGTK